jgi:oligoribonuclease NrnB/cAMP/cGMP phosphodiesterase (DHH superfamily)
LSAVESIHVLVTHTDLDGIGSAAVYIRLGSKGDKYKVVFVEPKSSQRFSRICGRAIEDL